VNELFSEYLISWHAKGFSKKRRVLDDGWINQGDGFELAPPYVVLGLN